MIAAKLVPVGILAVLFHGVSGSELVILFGAIGWIVMILKDIRPIKVLRADIREKDLEIAEKDKRIAAMTVERAALILKADQLAASRDFSSAIADALEGHEKRAEDRAEQITDALTQLVKDEQDGWAAVLVALKNLAPPTSS